MTWDLTDVEIAWDHRDVEMEAKLWELANEELQDRTPEVWWEDELKISTEPDRLQAALDRIISDGCSPGELLQQLREISELANRPVMSRRDVEAHLRRARKFSDELVFLPMTQVGSALGDTGPLQSDLTAHITQVAKYLGQSRRVVDPVLHRAVEEFTRYVHHRTSGRRHAEIAKLLSFVTMKRKTEGAQRMATSRLNVKKKLTKKDALRIKSSVGKADRGWIKERRIQKSMATHRGYVSPDAVR